MFENDDSSLTGTQEATTEDSSQSLPVSTAVPEAQGAVKETVKSPASDGYDPEWYKKDDRWVKRGMWKSEQDIIKSYHEADKILETKYKPIAKQYEGLVQKFKAGGLSLEQIDDYIKEYGTLKSPDNPNNQFLNYINELLDDDITSQEFKLAIQDLNEKKLSRRYPGLDTKAREQVIANERKLKELEDWKQSLEAKHNHETDTKSVTQGIDKIKSICSAKGFEFNDDIKDKFLDHCYKNKVDYRYMVQEFRDQFDEALTKSYENKIKSTSLEEAQKNQKTKISINNNISKPNETKKEGGFEELARSLIGRVKR